MRGKYLPDEPNKFFIDKMQTITRDLNQKENVSLPNPYNLARPILNSMAFKNKRLNLKTDEMKVPFAPMQTSPFGVETEPKNILPAGVDNTPAPLIGNKTSSAVSPNRAEMVEALDLGQDYVQIAKNQLNKPTTIVRS
jgi:hypothetical protein